VVVEVSAGNIVTATTLVHPQSLGRTHLAAILPSTGSSFVDAPARSLGALFGSDRNRSGALNLLLCRAFCTPNRGHIAEAL